MSSIHGVRPDESFRLIERQSRFRGRVVGVSTDRIVLPGGHETCHEVIHLPGAACVVPLLEDDDDEEVRVVLVEQFRNSVQGYIHELPAGMLEAGEDPADCAARELEEETGYRAESITHLATLCPLPGVSNHRMHFFMAEGLTPGEQQLEDAECLVVKRVPLSSLLQSILPPASAAGRVVVVDAKTHLGILHVAVLRGALP